ncbi:MAG: amidohydrolase family protein [Rhodospirillaceae bacterium]|jgi:5-methylthioadenosine/S-adenosylhomocysteine deaminase|nr:amidohydrolase family protein [Rhodospirillaceae bacterium]MBT6119331.1 amidohydrolase family protein [Rhodospirillaceae bacterium]
MADAPKPCDILIRNAYVVTVDDDRRIFPAGAVAITGRRIVAVGPEREVAAAFRAARVIDARGGVVHPGFVEGHYHASLHMSRGAIGDDPDNPALGHSRAGGGHGEDEPDIATYSKWFNLIDEEDEYTASLATAAELLRNGYTCFMEAGTVFEPDATAAACAAAGIRALVADPWLWDHTGIDQMAGEIARAPADTERCLAALGGQLGRNADPDALVRGYVCLYGCGTGSEELIKAGKAKADEAGVAFVQHQNFLTEDTAGDDARFGRHALCHLAELGVLGPNTTLVHMNVLRDDEVAAVASSGMSLVWHPGNYMFYALGKKAPARMHDLHARGVPVTFGTDAAKAWTFGDLPAIAYLVTREAGHYLSAEKVLEMVTRDGARAVGLQAEIGSLETGKRADLVIRAADRTDTAPFLDPVHEMMLVQRTHSVDTVLVDGRIVLRGGRLTRLDEAVVQDQARAWARRMVERIGLAPGGRWPLVT